jgi:hypothetical protein
MQTSVYKAAWDWIVLAFVLYSAVTVPLHLAFHIDSTAIVVVDQIGDVIFWLDVVVNLNTALYGKWGSIITSRRYVRVPACFAARSALSDGVYATTQNHFQEVSSRHAHHRHPGGVSLRGDAPV